MLSQIRPVIIVCYWLSFQRICSHLVDLASVAQTGRGRRLSVSPLDCIDANEVLSIPWNTRKSPFWTPALEYLASTNAWSLLETPICKGGTSDGGMVSPLTFKCSNRSEYLPQTNRHTFQSWPERHLEKTCCYENSDKGSTTKCGLHVVATLCQIQVRSLDGFI